ncbi:MAG: hypothetical protein MI861_03445, partial [Pirellulales bacterium]|nr:hypothetical protein [Pirellulales bacterium]
MTGTAIGRFREGLGALLMAVVLVLSVKPAEAVMEIDITQGNLKPMPIAVTPFIGATPGDRKLGGDIANIIQANLERSGLFAPVDRAAFIQRVVDPGIAPRFGDWRVINAQALVVGKVTQEPGGRLRTEFRLWDVLSGRQLAGQQFFTRAKNWRRVGHIIADAVYRRLTGEKGYFDTRVVFVDET